MPRIKLEQADRYSFSTEIQIYISHVNQGGHLDNGNSPTKAVLVEAGVTRQHVT